MRKILIGLTVSLTLIASAAIAKQPDPKPAQPQSAAASGKTYVSAAQVNELIAKAKSDRKDGQATVAEPMIDLGGHLEYRPSVGNAAVHEKEAEIFYVIDGSATLITGGKLTKETRTNPTNLSGDGIEGGSPRTVSKGDFILVPENTPHWFSAINSTLIVFSVHVPRP